ncbi:DUF6191 domain-containing protein [Actinomadura rayongensis]|uniref:Uncharacterized protein n=1 Tax=Actinomadura rayongensis TaxID=1429076 RepID=A0A6I4W984_9ACTN|nr:DUF6191 domain-containing protein [Actinomadura rayongensis]MXQ64835.1 hypothetical protein [Actinomadura rayongensis]
MAAVLIFLTIPGLAIGLIVLAVFDRVGFSLHRRGRARWRHDGSGRPVSAVGLEGLEVFYTSAKRHELDERRTALVLRDEEGVGDEARRVDLDAGRVTIRRP